MRHSSVLQFLFVRILHFSTKKYFSNIFFYMIINFLFIFYFLYNNSIIIFYYIIGLYWIILFVFIKCYNIYVISIYFNFFFKTVRVQYIVVWNENLLSACIYIHMCQMLFWLYIYEYTLWLWLLMYFLSNKWNILQMRYAYLYKN